MVTKKTTWLPYLLATVCVITVVVLSLVSYRVAQKTGKLRRELAQTRFDVERLDRIISDTQGYSEILSAVRSSIPQDHTEVARVLGSFETLARERGVALEMRVDDAAKLDTLGVNTLTITLNVSGSFTAIRSFLSDISHLRYHTTINTMTVDSTNGSLNGVIAIKLYIL